MPSVKIPKKSTATDMTPFVDVAFLILSFFMLATKFKPPEPVEITTPRSVSSDKLKEQDALLIEMDKNGRVYFTVNVQKSADEGIKKSVIEGINKARNLGLTQSEMNSFAKNTTVGVPFTGLKSLLAMSDEDRLKVKQPGIPVTDTLNNELTTWVATAVSAFQGHKLNYMIKGDNAAKYPSFKGIIDALRKNDINKYQLITDPEGVPAGTDLYKIQEAKRK
ncbi:ExbD/TolR family protein [Flavisolibacter ginsengisoli]|jgi:biopolymer transport protein ExbD|uniref:Biopolymer transport protein ExbD/TolR n=1 Tax=Flavisolibacter ginsengisoli DSM 18119 TaxID=1121884 RepID=A0A1M5AQY1_9BACT|nr:biopolymer transporter ExbD [Flavisolibacter ginsengisoli]SHF32650.1 Biopolymer transport protein ExbD/TolR [Flavisolibacter ginsengisoli DSM 18119]